MQVLVAGAIVEADHKRAVFDPRRKRSAGETVPRRIVRERAVHPAVGVGGDDDQGRGRIANLRLPASVKQPLTRCRRRNGHQYRQAEYPGSGPAILPPWRRGSLQWKRGLTSSQRSLSAVITPSCGI